MEYFHGQHTLFAMSDKRKYIKNPYKEEKLGTNQQKRSQRSGRGSLLNLTKVWEMDQWTWIWKKAVLQLILRWWRWFSINWRKLL